VGRPVERCGYHLHHQGQGALDTQAQVGGSEGRVRGAGGWGGGEAAGLIESAAPTKHA